MIISWTIMSKADRDDIVDYENIVPILKGM